ncbi:MAG: hypothetical protein ACE5DN_06910, partial [Flavobacteriales bacterium]
MKKTAPIIIMLLYASAGFAQIEKKVTYLLGVCPFDEVLRSYDTTNLSFINSASLLSNNYVITGVNGMSKHPLTDSLYVLYKESGNSSNRHLGVLNPITLKVNDKGATGDRFSGITFSDSGDLYGVTGDGANNPEELYTLDTGNGTDGESISWLPNSGSIYHWSGNGAPNVDQIFEKVDVQNFTTNPINVTGTGFNEEVDGSMYWGNYKFLFQNHYSEFWFVDTLGQAVNTGVTSDNDLKGLAFFDCFKIRSEANGICPNGSALLIASEGFS